MTEGYYNKTLLARLLSSPSIPQSPFNLLERLDTWWLGGKCGQFSGTLWRTSQTTYDGAPPSSGWRDLSRFM